MRIELRSDHVLIDGYVNAVARDSRPMFDEKGEKFVEQIVPKTFQRALEKSDEIFCLLDHQNSRRLGSTKQGNIELYEDNIGLRAICKITDSEVIEKSKDEKLRGWSFGFEMLENRREPTENGYYRRFVEGMNLLEVSIIDDQATPCYVGTSIETRVAGDLKIEYRAEFIKPKIIDLRSVAAVFDFGKYEKIINKLKFNGG